MDNPVYIRKPNPRKFIKNVDCGDSIKGAVCGIIILLVAVVDLSLFFGLNSREHTQVYAQNFSWVSHQSVKIVHTNLPQTRTHRIIFETICYRMRPSLYQRYLIR